MSQINLSLSSDHWNTPNQSSFSVTPKIESYHTIITEWSQKASSQRIDVKVELNNFEWLMSDGLLIGYESLCQLTRLRARAVIGKILKEEITAATRVAMLWMRNSRDETAVKIHGEKLLANLSNITKVSDFAKFVEKSRELSEEAQRVRGIGVYSINQPF